MPFDFVGTTFSVPFFFFLNSVVLRNVLKYFTDTTFLLTFSEIVKIYKNILISFCLEHNDLLPYLNKMFKTAIRTFLPFHLVTEALTV